MQHIIDFILELDRLKGVMRKNKPIGLDRYENSAEHSWQLALLAWSLQPYAPENMDMNRVIHMLLLHDVGEIDVGDTMVYVEEGWEARKIEELAAVTRIFALLPPVQGTVYLALWQEFEAGNTPEARFAHAADRAMPVLLNLANHGQSWRENGISYERVVRGCQPPIQAGCPALWDYLVPRLLDAQEQGWFGA